MSYQVHPDNRGGWIIYLVGDGGFDAIAVFNAKEDAELFAASVSFREEAWSLLCPDCGPTDTEAILTALKELVKSSK